MKKIIGIFLCFLLIGTFTACGNEMKRMEELENARKELEKNKEEKPVSQKMFRAI